MMSDAERADLLEAQCDRLADRAERIQEAYGRLRAVLVEAEQIAGGYRAGLTVAEGRLIHLTVLLRQALRDFPARPDDADNALLGTVSGIGRTAAPRKLGNSGLDGRRMKPRTG